MVSLNEWWESFLDPDFLIDKEKYITEDDLIAYVGEEEDVC